jgi:hypothetical protein
MQGPNRSKYTSVLEMHVKKPIVFNAITIRKKNSHRINKSLLPNYRFLYRVFINDCPIAVGVENSHKFWICHQPRNVRQTSIQISTTAAGATYRRY